ncbi:ubiquinone/menaquinone biosynthesis C-methylase UbiE [Bacillus tianshenii]|uniref:Ubiquinone/menaquinone biosynthesis C-methylase UbiE n=1 Tax=Sutcliffiella tianshenii TaxID=1463404 RepID=A0ABS2P5F8_9BACI|nr:ubiquinone/menaquinone biosynthesis C-methylase UbiE [Bacillus tianshenii]
MTKFKLGSKFDEMVSTLTDEEYLKLLVDSCTHTKINGVKMPEFPDGEFQRQSVGSSDVSTLYEAYNFYLHVKGYAEGLGLPLSKESKVLDFGCGWGRIIRFFFKDVADDNLLGVDVDPTMISICNETLGKGTYKVVNPHPPIEFIADNSLDIIFAYSVFSHLAEDAAKNWIKEFSRILRPGGIVLATTQGRHFLDYCKQFREDSKLIQIEWQKLLANSFVDMNRAISDYKNGKFLFSPTGGGDYRDNSFYGEAIISELYIKNNFEKYLKLKDFFDDSKRLSQALFVLKKE